MIVPASVIKNGMKEAEVEQAVQDAVIENQAENHGDEEQTFPEENRIELTGGNQEVLVNDEEYEWSMMIQNQRKKLWGKHSVGGNFPKMTQTASRPRI